jgi:hypothetical protein
MKNHIQVRFIIAAIILFIAAIGTPAQTSGSLAPTGPTPLQQNASTAVDGTPLKIEKFGAAKIEIKSQPAFTGTIIFETSDYLGSGWTPVIARNYATGALSSSTTAAGKFYVYCPACKWVRARVSAISSGAVSADGWAVPAIGTSEGSSGGGGGGSGDASASNQTDGSQKTQVVDGSGNVIGSHTNALDVSVRSSSNTQAVSASSLPLPTGAATAAKQPSLGTAGSPSTDVTTVQGIASMTPFLVTPSQSSASSLKMEPAGNVAAGATDSGNPLKIGGRYNATLPTLTDGQRGDAQLTPKSQFMQVVMDAAGNNRGANVNSSNELLVALSIVPTHAVTQSGNWSTRTQDGSGNALTSSAAGSTRPLDIIVRDTSGNPITSFGGSGGTASSFGSAIPSSGTAAGVYDGTNMVAPRSYDTDSGAGSQNTIGVNLRKTASGGSVEAGTLSDPLRVDPTGTTTQPVSASSLPLPTGAATSAKQPALGTAGSAASDVISVQGVASMTPLLATLSGTNNINNISGTVSLPTGASTAAKQPALGTAGSASTDVVTVQGIASMTPFLVTPSQSTASSLKVEPAGNVASGAADSGNPLKVGGRYNSTLPTLTDGQRGDLQLNSKGAVYVELYNKLDATNDSVTIKGAGTAGTADSTVTTVQGIASMTPLLVTPSQSTASSLKVEPAGNAAAGATDSGNPLKVGGKYNSTLPTLTDGQRGDAQLTAKSQLQTVMMDAAGNNRGANVTSSNELQTQSNDSGATGSAVPSRASYAGARSGANLVGIIQGDTTVAINISTATTTQLIAASGSTKIYITHYFWRSAGTTNFNFVYGTGSNCGTGTTDLFPAVAEVAQSGQVGGSGLGPVLIVPASQALCVKSSAAVQTSGTVTYTQY